MTVKTKQQPSMTQRKISLPRICKQSLENIMAKNKPPLYIKRGLGLNSTFFLFVSLYFWLGDRISGVVVAY